MKRHLLILAALLVCLSLPLCAWAEAARPADARTPECRNPDHWIGDGLDHNRPQSCWVTGHNNCDGMDHTRAACGKWGHYNCDGRDHALAACGCAGHFLCDGETHAAAPCGLEGHCTSDGKTHAPAACGIEGHYTCLVGHAYSRVVSRYCNANPQHMTCQGNPEHYCDPAQGGCGKTYLCSNSNSHTPCRMCGLLWCDRSLGSHSAVCGYDDHRPCYYAVRGLKYDADEHSVICQLCGKGKCKGRHGTGACVPACPACGGPQVLGYSHFNADCQHYWCVTEGEHGVWCTQCRNYKCNTQCDHDTGESM